MRRPFLRDAETVQECRVKEIETFQRRFEMKRFETAVYALTAWTDNERATTNYIARLQKKTYETKKTKKKERKMTSFFFSVDADVLTLHIAYVLSTSVDTTRNPR